MFFYLIYNSTLIKKELDNELKLIKILLYGGITYIVLHATLFIGGKNAILYSLKGYFWLFFILDCITLLLTLHFKHKFDISKVIFFIKNITKKENKIKNNIKPSKNVSFNPIPIYIPNKKINKINTTKPKKIIYESESDYSDSESEIDTDIDIDSFKRSLKM